MPSLLADCYGLKYHPVVFTVVLIFDIAIIIQLLHCHHHYHLIVSLALPLIATVQCFEARGTVKRTIGDRPNFEIRPLYYTLRCATEGGPSAIRLCRQTNIYALW